MAEGVSMKRKFVSGESLRAQPGIVSQGFMKESSDAFFEKKWKQFRAFFMDTDLQDGGICTDLEGRGEPGSKIVSKVLEFLHYKVVETECDPGKVFNV